MSTITMPVLSEEKPRGRPTQPTSSSVYLRPEKPTDSTTSTIHPKPSFITDAVVVPKQQYTDQQPDDDTNSTNIGSPPLFALIIGINEYKLPDIIPTLKGAVPDADDMRDYLQVHLGVPSSQIRNLRNSEATRAAIIEEIRAFSLNDEIEKGDPILIYYAGHGGSANTPKGWEVGSTGQIELLIPYDHSSPLEDGNLKHGIPDRTLGALLSQLASKKGDNITVILDCCHSGSGTRDLTLKVRKIDVGNVPSDLDRDIWSVIKSDESSKDVTQRGSMVPYHFAYEGLSSHVLLAACHSQGYAYERTSRGLFTVALLETLKKFGIDNLSYAALFDVRMPSLTSGQNPQCEGDNRNRNIFNGKVSDKRTVNYKIRKSEGETYVMPDAGEAAGITVGAEFEVYQDLNSGHLLGTVVARKPSAFSTTLDAKESEFALERDGVAFKSCAGTEERVRIYAEDQILKDLVKKIDPNQRIIQLVERDHGAEFGIALENGEVVFNIYDPVVTAHGLTRMPFTREPTLEVMSPIIRAAAHFYWHRRRTLQSGRGLAKKVDVKVTELEELKQDPESVEHDDDLNPKVVYGPTASGGWKSVEDFDPQTGTTYGWRLYNDSGVSLYPALFYFDSSDWSIKSYYEPPIAQGAVEPSLGPLKGKGYLTVGYGDSGSRPYTFFLREGQDVDVGILKLFLSRKQVNLSHVAQASPFKKPVSHEPSYYPRQRRRGTTPVRTVVPKPTNLPLPWDTVEIPVVQRRPGK